MINNLTDHDKKIIFECLEASVRGPFFPDWEFSTLMGLEKRDFIKIIELWPEIEGNQENIRAAIINSIVNLLGYPHGCESIWDQFISVDKKTLEGLYQRIKDSLI